MSQELPESHVSEAMRAARNSFMEKYSSIALATSLDGRTFSFQGPVSLFLKPGDYARITSAEGVVHIGQVLTSEVREFDGPEILVQEEENDALAGTGLSVQGASIRMKVTSLRGSGVLLSDAGGRKRQGLTNAKIEPASEDEVRSIQSVWSEDRPTLPVGKLRGSESLVASVDARGFNRHTFMCGQSGSGKTYSLGVVLEQILLHTDLRVAVLDPNADYVHLDSLHPQVAPVAAEGDDVRLRERYLARTAELKVLRPHVEDDARAHPLRIHFGDLSRDDQAKVLMLDPLQDREEYDAFRGMADALDNEPYQLRDVLSKAKDNLSSLVTRQVLLRVSNLGISEWGVWANDQERSLAETLAGDWRSIVLDVSGFERPVERSIVALATLRHFWSRRTDRKPVLLVIDEAHNVCPREAADPIQRAATELAITIAGEGRKYGIYLLLSTQRPDKIHPNVVSQCDNLMLMRMNSQADLAQLQQLFSFVPPAIMAESGAFKQGEALLAGPLVSSPTLTRMGQRISREGGADVKPTWAIAADERGFDT